MKTRYILLNTFLVLLILAGLAYLGRQRIIDVWDSWMTDPTPEAISYNKIIEQRLKKNNNANQANIFDNINTNISSTDITEIPREFNLEVPFTVQAPYANWDELHEEACEEASAIIVHYYYQDKTFTPEIAEREIQDFVDYENSTLGFYKDTTAQETADLIKSYWGYQRVDVLVDPSVDDIKQHIANGRPVIVPAAGRELGNPNFTAPGPLYHMLVVRGYTADTFITNDVGTRKGDNYVYDTSVLMKAIHDWNGGDVANGTPRVIVVYPNN